MPTSKTSANGLMDIWNYCFSHYLLKHVLFYVFKMTYLQKATFRKPLRKTVYLARIFQAISSNRSNGKILIDLLEVIAESGGGGSENSNMIVVRKEKEKIKLEMQTTP